VLAHLHIIHAIHGSSLHSNVRAAAVLNMPENIILFYEVVFNSFACFGVFAHIVELFMNFTAVKSGRASERATHS
jgi:hypothetical protein